MRIVIASLLLLVINAAPFVPGIENNPALGKFQTWVPLISVLIAVYLLIQAIFLSKRPSPATAEADAPPPAPSEPDPKERQRESDAHVVHFVGLLQEKGRLIDFIMDDISSYDNEQVGAAARVVHQGCAQVIKEHLAPTPVQASQEGAAVTLDVGYDPKEYRAVGKLAGNPPFQGTLLHHGWKAAKLDLPRVAGQTSDTDKWILTPAEVEIKTS